MIVETEPSGLMMIRYKFYFNQQRPDPEDPWVLAYFQEHGLEPRRELHEEHEGIPYKVFHFGQCYLGRHVTEQGTLYQRGNEHTVLAQHLLEILSHTQDADLREATTRLVAAFQQDLAASVSSRLNASAVFVTTLDRNLRVVIDDTIVREAFLMLRRSIG
jgi:hypothetical protein